MISVNCTSPLTNSGLLSQIDLSHFPHGADLIMFKTIKLHFQLHFPLFPYLQKPLLNRPGRQGRVEWEEVFISKYTRLKHCLMTTVPGGRRSELKEADTERYEPLNRKGRHQNSFRLTTSFSQKFTEPSEGISYPVSDLYRCFHKTDWALCLYITVI